MAAADPRYGSIESVRVNASAGNTTATSIDLDPCRGRGIGSVGHIGGLFFQKMTGTTSLPQVQAGNIRASPKRIASAPDIPTVDEAGLKDLYITTWTGFFAPKGTSDEIVAKLGAAARAALADPDVQKKLAAVGQDVYPPDQQSAAPLARLQDDDIRKWWPIIREANIKSE